MKSKVELIYDADCPNVKEAREQLRRALTELGIFSRWQEWDRGCSASPNYVRSYGSPTILVNGQDVANATPSAGADSCRIYKDKNGQTKGVPPVELIKDSLARSAFNKRPSHLAGFLAVFPVIGTVLVPGLTCPACWPAYTALLSSLGLGFVNYTPYLLPLTVLFLALALSLLGYRAKKSQKKVPFVLGLVAASMILTGRFLFVSNFAFYGGIALLIFASIWDLKIQIRVKKRSCCVVEGDHKQIQ